MKRIILPLLLTGACTRTISPPPPPDTADNVYVILQSSRRIAVIDENTAEIKGYLPTGNGDIPNHLIMRNDTLLVINSGGFSGSPSVPIIESNTGEILREIPLPTMSNPLKGILIGDSLIMTDFGKRYSENLLLLDIETGQVDSVGLAPRPIDIIDGIYATANGMDENYNYPYPAKLFLLNDALEKLDSLSLSPGSGGVERKGDTIFFLSSGIPGQTGATLYMINGQDLHVMDSVSFQENLYSLGVSKDRILVGDFFGKLYIMDRELNLVDTVRIGYTINCITEKDNSFYITINGFSSGKPNYLLIMGSFRMDSIRVSDSDEGIYCPFKFSRMP